MVEELIRCHRKALGMSCSFGQPLCTRCIQNLDYEDELTRELRLEKESRIRANTLRRWIFARLRKMGYRREQTSYRSAYYTHESIHVPDVRVSNHEVPLTDERQFNDENGGFTWATTWRSFIICDSTSWMDAARWLVDVRRMAR